MNRHLRSVEHRRLYELIRTVREEAGFTQVDLADAIGRPQSHVSKIESGERKVDFLELVDICSAIGLSISEFSTRFEKASEETS